MPISSPSLPTAEDARAVVETILNGVLESALDGVVGFEAVRDEAGAIVDFRCVLANAKAAQVLQRTQADLVGSLMTASNPGVVQSGLFDRYCRVMETGEPYEDELHYDFEHFDGWFRVSAVRQSSEALTVTFRDITERRTARAAVEASESLLQSVLNSSLDSVMVFEAVRDGAGQIVDFTWLMANPRSQALTGRAPDYLVGRRLLEELPGNRESGLFDAYARVVETGEPLQHEIAYDHDDITAWISLTAVKLGDGFTVTFRDVTERKEAEAELRALNEDLEARVADRTQRLEQINRDLQQHVAARQRAEQQTARLAAIVASSQDAITRQDLTGVITEWNAAAESIYGYAKEEAVGHHIGLLEPAEQAGESQRLLEQVRKGEAVVAYETVRQTRDGQTIPVSLTLSPIRDADGQIVAVSSIERDITVHREYEAALEASEAAFRGTFDNAAVGIAHVGFDGSWLLVNRRLAEIVGYTRDELLTMTFQDITHPDDLDADLEQFEQLMVGDLDGYQMEKRYIHEEGHIVWILLTTALQRDVDGTPQYCISIVQDISERKAAIDALRKSEDRLRMATASGQLGTWDYDLVTEELRWDERTKALFGLPAHAEVSYDVFLQGLHPEDRERTDAVVQEATSGASDGRYSIEYRTVGIEDGVERWVDARGQTYFDDAGEPVRFVGTVMDITERKEAEEALQLLNETLERRVAERTAELERTNRQLQARNRELQDFAYVASHDLQEPLRKVRAFGDLLREDYGAQLDDMGAHYLDRIHDAASRMSQLITDLLAFSRVTTRGNPFEEVDLNTVLAHVLSDLEVRISEVEATIITDDLPPIEADATQLRQLLQNLVGNALKFRREGVRPVVEVRAERVEIAVEEADGAAEGEEGATANGGEVREPHLRLTVRDNGIGFEEKYLDRIFTPFQRLHGRGTYEGTGMGLAICRRIVERHHGTISATSAPEQGAAFIVTLPIDQPDVADPVQA